MSLRDLFDEASHAVDSFKHPNIHEAVDRLHEITMAAGLGGFKGDEVTSLSIHRGTVSIRTRYSVRCCAQTGRFDFPETILDADDPVRAARLWGLTKARDDAAAKVRWDAETLKGSQARLAEAEAKLKEIPS